MTSALSHSKKGQVWFEITIIGVILFVSAIAFVLISMTQKNITDEFLTTPEFNESTEAGQMLKQFDSGFTTTLDNMFIIVFALFWVFIIVSSLFVDASPIFLIISIILMIILLVVIGVMSNTYEEFINDGNLYTFASGFPKMNYIMEHLVMLMLFIGISGLLAIYGKSSFGGGGFG